MFNLMKKSFHKENVYPYELLLLALGEHDQVDIMYAKKELFKYWDLHLNMFYKGMVPRTVLFNFYFFSIHVQCVWKINQYNDAPHTMDPPARDFAKKSTTLSVWNKVMKQYPLKILFPPSLHPIKQVEMWSKWWKIVLDECKGIVWPNPPDNIIKKVRK